MFFSFFCTESFQKFGACRAHIVFYVLGSASTIFLKLKRCPKLPSYAANFGHSLIFHIKYEFSSSGSNFGHLERFKKMQKGVLFKRTPYKGRLVKK